MEAWAAFRTFGTLPEAGGFLDQAEKTMAAFDVIDGAVAALKKWRGELFGGS